MQLRFVTALTASEYVRVQAWHGATLPHCPLHPTGGCSFRRNGTYGRVDPPGTRVPRWYCPEGHCTFSLLADCFAARLPGSLAELEQVVVEAEQAASLEAAANRVRTNDFCLPGALRWTRRRLRQVHLILEILIALIPQFWGCQPTVGALRRWLQCDSVLPQRRELGAKYLHRLPPPLGFAGARQRCGTEGNPIQHDKGPDPPRSMS